VARSIAASALRREGNSDADEQTGEPNDPFGLVAVGSDDGNNNGDDDQADSDTDTVANIVSLWLTDNTSEEREAEMNSLWRDDPGANPNAVFGDAATTPTAEHSHDISDREAQLHSLWREDPGANPDTVFGNASTSPPAQQSQDTADQHAEMADLWRDDPGANPEAVLGHAATTPTARRLANQDPELLRLGRQDPNAYRAAALGITAQTPTALASQDKTDRDAEMNSLWRDDSGASPEAVFGDATPTPAPVQSHDTSSDGPQTTDNNADDGHEIAYAMERALIERIILEQGEPETDPVPPVAEIHLEPVDELWLEDPGANTPSLLASPAPSVASFPGTQPDSFPFLHTEEDLETDPSLIPLPPSPIDAWGWRPSSGC
jgi:hypothetical protein